MRPPLLTRAIALLGALTISVPLLVGTASAAEPPHGHDGDDQEHPTEPAPDPAGVTEETFTLGPFHLAPQGQPGDSVRRDFVDVPRPEGDIAIRSIDWGFVDGEGRSIDGDTAHLHHLVLLEDSRRDTLCGTGSPQAARFAGAGADRSRFVLPEPYAYHSPAEANWQGVYMAMNTTDEPIDVSITYTVGYTDAAADDFVHVDQYFFDVTGCWHEASSEFQVPGDGGPDSVYEHARTVTMRRDGVMRFGGGHLHEGGIDVTLTGPDGEVCRSTAVEGHGHEGDHHVDGAPTTGCSDLDEEFVAGDEYTLTARYHNDEPIAGAMGIMGIYANHTSPPPPDPTIDLEVEGIERGALVGTVTCDPEDQLQLYGSVEQEKGTLPVSGTGMLEDVECGTDATPFRLPLSGDGVLVPGPVTYYVDAWSQSSNVWDDASGELTLRRLTSLRSIPPDEGPLPITFKRVAGRSVEGPVVYGTVTCAEPTDLVVAVSGSQRAGRYHLPVSGIEELACDGKTSFEVPFTSFRGQLRPGLAAVTVNAYSSNWSEGEDDLGFPVGMPEVSRKTQVMVLRSRTPEPDFSPEANPESPITIGTVRRVDDQLVVDLALADCPAGREAQFDVTVRPVSLRILGRWFDPSAAGQHGWEFVNCEGGEISTVVTVPDTFEGDQVVVDVGAYVMSPDTWEFEESYNADTVDVTSE